MKEAVGAVTGNENLEREVRPSRTKPTPSATWPSTRRKPTRHESRLKPARLSNAVASKIGSSDRGDGEPHL